MTTNKQEPCQECGGNGAGGEHEEDCAMAQPLPDDKSKVVLFETDNFVCEYVENGHVKNAVFERVMEFFKDHEAFSGECIMQSDNPLFDAPNVLADIADEIIKFYVQCK